MAPAPEPKLAVACLMWEKKVPSATVVGLARWVPRTARCPRSLLPTRRSSLCSSCPGFPAGNGHCQVVGLWRCLFPPSQANGCAICEIVATVLASKCACVGLLGCNRAMLAASREQCRSAQDRERWRSLSGRLLLSTELLSRLSRHLLCSTSNALLLSTELLSRLSRSLLCSACIALRVGTELL